MDEKFKLDYPVRTPETVISGLIELEREMTNRTIELLRERHQREKDEWTKLYDEREKELNVMRARLTEMESKIKKLQDEYAEERTKQTETVRITLEELKKRKEADQMRWQTVEAEVKDLRKIVQETENRYQQEVKRFEYFKNLHETSEKEWNKKLQEKEEEILKIREEITSKEQEWLKLRTIYEEKISNLEAEISNLNQMLSEEKVSRTIIIEKKDAQIQELNKTLQEAAAMLSEQGIKNQELTKKLSLREDEFRKIEKQYQTLLSQIDEERKKWKLLFQKEHDEWQAYRRGIEEREQMLRFETEEQINRVNELFRTLEKQLAEERKKCKELETESLNKSKEINRLEEKLATESKNWEKLLIEERELLAKQQADIIMQYEKIRQLKEEEARKLREEMTSLRAALSESAKLHEIEKTKRIELEKNNEALEIDKKNLIAQSEIERVNARNLLLEEQQRSEKRIQEIRSLLAEVKKAREEEVNNLTNELHLLQAQFNELRALYQTVLIERDDKAAKVKELESQIETLTKNFQEKILEFESKYKQFTISTEREKDFWKNKFTDVTKKLEDIHKIYETQIKNLETQLTAAKSEMNKLESSKIQESEIQDTTKKYNDLNRDYEILLKEIALSKQEKEQMTKSFDEQKKFYENRFSELETYRDLIVKQYESNLKNINDINYKLSEQISQLQNQLTEKSKIIEELEFNINSLEKQLLIVPSITKERDDLLKEVATLNDKINSLNKQIENLTNELVTKSEDINRYKMEIVRVNKILDSLTTERQDLQDKTYNRQAVIDELSEKLKALDREIKVKDDIISDLRSQIDALTSPTQVEKSETILTKEQIQAEIEKELDKIKVESLPPEKPLAPDKKKIERRKIKINPIYVFVIASIIVGASLLITTSMQKIRYEIAYNQYIQAISLYLKDNIIDAYNLLSKAVALNPEHKKIRTLFYLVASELADKYIESKNYKEALKCLKLLRKYYPEDMDIMRKYNEMSRQIKK